MDVRREPPFRPPTKDRLAHLERQVAMLDDMIGFIMKEVAVERSTAASPLDIHARTETMSLMHAYIKSIGADTEEDPTARAGAAS